MANVKITKGIMFARIIIGHRFMSQNLVLDGLPKGASMDISKVIEENIRRVRGGPISQPVSPTKNQDALEVLKLRFARGEITKEQFEEMRRTLE
jgi:hypothetical protein